MPEATSEATKVVCIKAAREKRKVKEVNGYYLALTLEVFAPDTDASIRERVCIGPMNDIFATNEYFDMFTALVSLSHAEDLYGFLINSADNILFESEEGEDPDYWSVSPEEFDIDAFVYNPHIAIAKKAYQRAFAIMKSD